MDELSGDKRSGSRKKVSDKRMFARFTAELSLKYSNYSSLDSTRENSGKVLNVSAQGLGMFTSEHLGPGCNLDILLKLPDTDKEIRVKGKVIWAKKVDENKYNVGVSLVNPELMGMSVVLRAIDIHTSYRC